MSEHLGYIQYVPFWIALVSLQFLSGLIRQREITTTPDKRWYPQNIFLISSQKHVVGTH